jgi:hypothetical protein
MRKNGILGNKTFMELKYNLHHTVLRREDAVWKEKIDKNGDARNEYILGNFTLRNNLQKSIPKNHLFAHVGQQLMAILPLFFVLLLLYFAESNLLDIMKPA